MKNNLFTNPISNKKTVIDSLFRRSKQIKEQLLFRKNSTAIDIELMNFALGYDLTKKQFLLCQSLLAEKRENKFTFSFPKNKEDFTNIKMLLPSDIDQKEGKKTTTLPGVYLINDNEGDRYVGHSIRLTQRLQEHIIRKNRNTIDFIVSLRKKPNATCTFYIVSNRVVERLNNYNLEIKKLLIIMEQYLIIKSQPTVNRTYIALQGGDFSNPAYFKEQALRHPNRKPLYYYLIEYNKMTQSDKSFSTESINTIQCASTRKITLIQVLPAIGTLGILLGYTGKWAVTIVNRGGLLRNKVYCTTNELLGDNINVNTISENEFVYFIKSILNINHSKQAKRIILINENTGEEIGPYPSITYVCKNIIVGGDRSVFTRDRTKPYRGYYIRFVD